MIKSRQKIDTMLLIMIVILMFFMPISYAYITTSGDNNSETQLQFVSNGVSFTNNNGVEQYSIDVGDGIDVNKSITVDPMINVKNTGTFEIYVRVRPYIIASDGTDLSEHIILSHGSSDGLWTKSGNYYYYTSTLYSNKMQVEAQTVFLSAFTILKTYPDIYYFDNCNVSFYAEGIQLESLNYVWSDLPSSWVNLL